MATRTAPTLADIDDARRRIAGIARVTPVYGSGALSRLSGREVPARILAVAAGRNQTAILDDLDALARASLVRLGDRGWIPQHLLVAEIVADSLSRPERGRLHEMLAHALRIDEADLSELARHLAAAGDVDAAADAFARAAFQSLERFASEEAESLRVTPQYQNLPAL